MQIKVVCLNIWLGILLDRSIAFLKEQDADIILLQEVFDAREESWNNRGLRSRAELKKLGYAYEAFSPTFVKVQEEGKIPQGNLILSKFPIVSSEEVFFDVPFNDSFLQWRGNFETTPRNLQHVVIDANGTELNVFNTQGIWGEDGDDNERRLAMGQTIADAVRGKSHVILGGDFNVQEKTETIKLIESVGVKNIFKDELKTTFNLRRKTHPGFATAVVDLLMISPDISVLEHSCPDVDVTDHLPLIAVLEV